MKSLFKNPAKDAKKIQETIDYRVLKAAWDSYARIHKGDFKAKCKTSTPAWHALFAIQNYKGKFKNFDIEELHLLQSLTGVQETYDGIIQSLNDHSENEDLAEYILRAHPDLEKVVPKESLYVDKIGTYIANQIKAYQTLLLEFYQNHQKDINSAIERLSNETNPAP